MATADTNIPIRNVESDTGSQYVDNTIDTTDDISSIFDRDWAKRSFLVSDAQLESMYDVINRYWSTADTKFYNAVIGSSLAVNPRPQYTRYCDIRVPGRMPGRNIVSVNNSLGNYGQGTYYSEAIDDNAQKIFLRFGVPQFNTISNFLLNAANPDMGMLARTGRVRSGFFYRAGQVIGLIGTFTAFPAVSTFIWAGIGISKVTSTILGNSSNKYYTMKPTMEIYWSAVNSLVNAIGVNRGLFPAFITSATGQQTQRIGNLYKFNTAELSDLASLFPGIMSPEGFFDVFAIAARPQTLANKLFEDDFNRLSNSDNGVQAGFVNRENSADPRINTYISNGGRPTLAARLNALFMFKSWFVKEKSDASGIEIDPRSGKLSDSGNPDANKTNEEGFKNQFLSYLDSNFRDGAEFAIFQVDYTGSVSESFSNSAVESDLSSKINSTSSDAREARFTFADGNVVGGVVGAAAGAVKDAVTGLASGALNTATFGLGDNVMSALSILTGNGYIDIPKHWQSSSASLPRSTYNIQLVSPYGNVISQMLNIYIPLCMLLAGTLPLSTGKSSYTSPFLVQLWDRGRSQINLGIMESLTITRGTSNLGFTNLGQPLAIDVSFSVLDLSSIMHMPVSTGALFNDDTTLDADNILKDYLAVLAGQDIYSQIYALPRAKMNLAKYVNSYKKFGSPAYWAGRVQNTIPFGNAIEGMVIGSNMTLNPIQN